MNTNTVFSRELLKRALEDVRAYRKSTGDRFAFKLIDAWVYKVGTDHWEFHFGKFYWHGSADNGYEARAKGWCAWLGAQEKSDMQKTLLVSKTASPRTPSSAGIRAPPTTVRRSYTTFLTHCDFSDCLDFSDCGESGPTASSAN